MASLRKRIGRDGWKQHIEQWKSSGLSQSEYCRRNDLNSKYFSNWKRKLSTKTRAEVSEPEFVPVEVLPAAPKRDAFIKITMPNGIRIDMPVDLPESNSQKFLNMLMTIAC